MAFPSTFLDIQNDVILRARLLASLDLPNVKDWINRSYFQVCVDTESIVTSATMAMTPGSTTYTFPSQVARVKQMFVNPVGSALDSAPLILTTLDEILSRRQNGGDVVQAGYTSMLYTMIGATDFDVWPTPAAADVITIYYAAYPTPLSAPTDVPVIEEPYASNLLVYGACAQAGDFKGDPATADWANSFQTWMGEYTNHLNLKRGDQPGQFYQWGDGWDVSYGGSLYAS